MVLELGRLDPDSVLTELSFGLNPFLNSEPVTYLSLQVLDQESYYKRAFLQDLPSLGLSWFDSSKSHATKMTQG